MADRIPLYRDSASQLPAEMQAADNLALSTMPLTLQSLVNDVLTSSSGSPLVTSAGDFITTSAA